MLSQSLLAAPWGLSDIDIPMPSPQRAEVLLTVIRSGVCHSDTHLRAGSDDLGRTATCD